MRRRVAQSRFILLSELIQECLRCSLSDEGRSLLHCYLEGAGLILPRGAGQ
jgi:hypothetical protein